MNHAICYVSTASDTLSKIEILDLLQSSKEINTGLQIKGILLHSGGNFFQLLEGEKSTISKLYKKICQDKRHHNIIKILDKEIEAPNFTSYKSEFCTISDIQTTDFQVQEFLLYQKQMSADYYQSISYLINRFAFGNDRVAM